MHSVAYRTNGVVTFAITILAALCVAATVTDLFNRPTPEADIQVLHYNWLQKSHGNDEASLTFNISADLRSLFTWNTKQVFIFIAAEYGTQKNQLNQVSLWDAIVPSKEHGKFWVHTTNKYVFVDQGTNLQGKEFNLTMHWHVMPRTGYMYAGKKVISGFQLPDSYR